MHFLIITANFYQNLADELTKGAVEALEKEQHNYHKITVPGSLEIPSVVSYAVDLDLYDGFIALGCIIRGETIHHEIVAKESTRSLNELAINMNLAIGNGIISAENRNQAIDRAYRTKRNKGAAAAITAIKMAKIRDKFQGMLNN